MSGPKAYTMKEMKGIVEYLVEHRAFSEYRGRKMWMDFANSSLTTRTWQSLKETFLKRILPDIQNPYYKLTRDQVCSFKQGVDVEIKERNNRLEIRTSEESTNNADNQKNMEPVQSSSAKKPNEVDKTPGEDIKSEKILSRNRSSADTYVIEETSDKSGNEPVHIKTTEELLADLGEGEPINKPLKDILEFEHSESLTAVKRVLKDFETESEDSDKEPQMQIVEDSPDNDNQEIILVEDSENLENLCIENERILDEEMEVEIGPVFIAEVTSNVLQGIDNWLEECEVDQEIHENNEAEPNVQENNDTSRDVSHESENLAVKERETEVLKVSEPVVIEESETKTADDSKQNRNEKSLNGDKNQSSLSTTSDTIIPNNQEVLNTDTTKSQKTDGAEDIAPLKKVTRKRSASQDVNVSKKQKVDGVKTKINGDVNKTPPSSNNTETLFEAVKNSTVDNGTLQDAQDMNISPEIKNPCLTSVSLFEEEFNTTKYIDSEDETPISEEQKTPSAKKDKATLTDVKRQETSIKDKEQAASANENLKIVKKTKRELNRVQKKQETNVENQQKQHSRSESENTIQTVKHKIYKKQNETNKHTDGMKTTSENEVAAPQTVTKQNKSKELNPLKSNSESDVEISPENSKEKLKKIGQAFGFVPGTTMTAPHRRRSLRRIRNKLHRNSWNMQDSSEWEESISEPECSEFISPPRGRRNRHAWKYRKPQSARIMALEEEGGLFIMHGNRVIPLVKHGKTLTYVTYDAMGNSEEEGSMWRQKYVDEKKKSAELQRKLAEAEALPRGISPILQTNASRNVTNTISSTVQKPTETDSKKQMHIKESDEAGKIQITLSKNEETVNLEGHWPQVLPIVQQVMSIFYKAENTVKNSSEKKPEVKDKPAANEQEEKELKTKKEDIGGLNTPIIPVIDLASRAVEDLENEIFKKIEELDKEDKTESTSKVTTRRAARTQKNPSTSSEQSEPAPKKKRKSKTPLKTTTDSAQKRKKSEPKTPQITERTSETGLALAGSKPEHAESKTEDSKPKQPALDSPNNAQPSKNTTGKDKSDDKVVPFEPPFTRSRKSGNESDPAMRPTRQSGKVDLKDFDSDDEGVRYMLPPERKSRRISKHNSNKAGSTENPHEISHRSRGSVDSSRDYLDSNSSPANKNARRKRKLCFPVRKVKHTKRRTSLPTVIVHDVSLDSSLSKYFIPKKSQSPSTSDSAVYKTDSYQILMGNRRLSIKKLDTIDEGKSDDNLRHFRFVSKESIDNSNVVEVASSSSVSLPLSPELSVVENISITKENIRTDSHPTINETQANDSLVNELYNQYLFSSVDVSVPLMQQDCELLNTCKIPKSTKKKSPLKKSPMKVSHFLDKICMVNMSENNTLSESLDTRLRNLLLESAKKISKTNKENEMEVDRTVETVENVPKVEPKRKRCSTPQKKSAKPKAKKIIDVSPVIEEHTESCGRISCPPIMSWKPNLDENANNSEDIKLTRKPKNIIKVKIQRPTKSQTISEDTSQISVYTDSGINQSSADVQNSVELIHNHSETCLQANECVESVEFLQESESVITIDSESSEASEEKSLEEIYGTPTDIFQSPVISNSSIITEDLSYPPSPTKWYLFSDDETKTMNAQMTSRPEPATSNSQMTGFSNLKQLFPITCLVPDLSTISELSKECDSKGFDDGSSKSSNCY